MKYACLIFLCNLQQITQQDQAVIVNQVATEKMAARAGEARADKDVDDTDDDDDDDAAVDNGGERATERSEPGSETGGSKMKRERKCQRNP